jgi:hypothetical protein
VWRDVSEVADHLSLRPALARIFGSKQYANDARRFRRTEIRACTRLQRDRLATRTLD